ncbi:MAG TPA: GH3 auxin-responsive promoter family protein [Verrucomicrobiae bacterium]|nr:GH3 auxin-responsive promoter family protein [Verrucomicrobiae bacterium]
MKLSAAIANCLWATANVPALARFHRALERPEEAQSAWLHRTLKANIDCAYGKKYRFDEIRTYEEFSNRVPLVDYEDIEPWVKRIMRGENQVLTTEKVTHLIPTSGSTRARKLIPFTNDLKREFNAAIGPWILELFQSQPSLVCGPAYWSITPAFDFDTFEESRVPIGFEEDAAYLGGWRKHLVQSVMAVPSALGKMFDSESFRYATLLCLLRQRDLRLISVWHPSFLTLLLDALPVHWDNLLSDVRTGEFTFQKSISDRLNAKLSAKPLPARENELRSADPRKPETIWPALRLISSWGDGPAAMPLHELQSRFPNVVFQSKGLLATEACVTVPLQGRKPVALCSHFFEFIDESGKLKRVHELCADQTYEVVVTTGGGLWRYRLKDCVTVDGFVGRTPSLRFVGRSGNVSDLCGEKLSDSFVSGVIERAVAEMSARPRFVMLAPEQTHQGWRYVLYFEGNAPIDLVAIEEGLRANPHYAYCRRLGQLSELRLHRVRSKGFEIFLNREISEGRRAGDVKPCFFSKKWGWTEWFEKGG